MLVMTNWITIKSSECVDDTDDYDYIYSYCQTYYAGFYWAESVDNIDDSGGGFMGECPLHCIWYLLKH